MSPSTAVRRAGVVTASALTLTLGGAVSAGAASAVTVCPTGQILSSTGKCVKKTVGSAVPPAPTKTSSGSTSGGSTGGSGSGGISVPRPSVPLPVPTRRSGGGSGGTSSSGSAGSLQLPRLPTASLPGSGSGGGSTGPIGGITGPTIPGTASTSGSSADGKNTALPGAQPGAGLGGGGMLGLASAYLPASGILGFASLSGAGGTAVTIPTAGILSAVPSPLLANQPASELAAVQAPLLAAGESAGQGGTVLASFGGYALPGLLVVLATAIVATVGAGNLRVWQARLAARRV